MEVLMELKWKESNFICALRSGQSSAGHKIGLKCKYTLHSDRLKIQTIRKLSKKTEESLPRLTNQISV